MNPRFNIRPCLWLSAVCVALIISIPSSGFGQTVSGPTLLTPLDNAAGVTTTVMLRWTSSPLATRYNVEVATDPSVVNMVFRENVPATHVSFTAPDPGQTYWWRVYADVPFGHSDYSQTFSFTSEAVVPGAPMLLTPLDGAVGELNTVELRWTAIPNVTRYNVEVATDSELMNKILQENVPANHAWFTAPEPGKTYWWRVYADGPGGHGPYSPRFHFTTETLKAVDRLALLLLMTRPTSRTTFISMDQG